MFSKNCRLISSDQYPIGGLYHVVVTYDTSALETCFCMLEVAFCIPEVIFWKLLGAALLIAVKFFKIQALQFSLLFGFKFQCGMIDIMEFEGWQPKNLPLIHDEQTVLGDTYPFMICRHNLLAAYRKC
ncbi:hypothetical protein SUGI_0224850 [Cryptomeria japonica]|nr:hypothetical protein SUGI_0224850 [Cryptomeria japonica]